MYSSTYLGRRFSFRFGNFCQIIGLTIVYFFFDHEYSVQRFVIPFGVFVFFFGFSVGLGSSLQVYVTEIVPPVGIGAALFFQWLFTGIMGKTVPLVTFHL